MTASKKILLSSLANFLFILKLQETIPPKALIGSHAKANWYLFSLSFLIETPHGFACFTITVPELFGKDLEIVKAENISL
jgi:hypothetical protein